MPSVDIVSALIQISPYASRWTIAGFLLLAEEEIFEVAILHFLFGHELGFIIEAFAA